jgi:DNA polymerase/3'-5' exonuclease PolX
MKIKYARGIAEKILIDLFRCCDRIELAGSVRRGKTRGIKDIEFVAIPKFVSQPDIFGTMRPTSESALFTHVRKTYDVTSGGRTGQKMVRFTVCENISVVVYTATLETWGYIMAIHTGPAELSKRLVTNLKTRGFTPADGIIRRGREQVPVTLERTVFKMAGMPYLTPDSR